MSLLQEIQIAQRNTAEAVVIQNLERQGLATPELTDERCAAEAPPSGAAFGIIDPDYARVFTMARIVAWQHGYSICAQGSFTRDLDLLMVPWTDHAHAKVDHIVARICDAAGLTVQHGSPSEKPYGRKAWSLLFPGFSDPRWVDLSVFEALQPNPAQPTPATTALTGQILVMAELLKSALGVVRTVTGDTLEDDEMLQDLITQSEAAIATVLTEHAMGAAT